MLMWGTFLLIGQWKSQIMSSKNRRHGQSVRLLLNKVDGCGQWTAKVIEGVVTDMSRILESVGLNCSLLALHVPETNSRFSPLFVCFGFD